MTYLHACPPFLRKLNPYQSLLHKEFMAKQQPFLQFLLLPFLVSIITICDGSTKVFKRSVAIYPVECTRPSLAATCSAYLYHISRGLSMEQIGALYSVNASLIKSITRKDKVDYLVSVPCSCEAVVNLTTAYFHDTRYLVQKGDTPNSVTANVFSGQAYGVGVLRANEVIPIHLPCACLPAGGGGGSMAVSYTVQSGDTLTTIAALLSSDVGSIQRMNERLAEDPEFLDQGWVLFVPMGTAPRTSPPATPSKEKKSKIALVVGISIAVAFLIAGSLILFLCWRKKSPQLDEEDLKTKTEKSFSIKSIQALERQYTNRDNFGDGQPFESERPVTFNLVELEEATANFDETRKLGEGGYGSVYFGILGGQEVAVKKMKSNKSNEFFAELKVLCKIHHKNVVELIGYAASDDHLYLVYECVQNGSLSEHLHDPLLKGHQPLSWNARAQIALDAARGIEYIHDHTKSCYVHRDIKSSNILLDNGLRAKVADFGLVKLVERSGEEDCLASRLVGTPGYLPPESVRELQMTTKTDVFAFGVVLAELITGQRALIRDNREPNKMKSLVSVINKVFGEEDIETALEEIIDGNLKNNYPIEEVYKMAEISAWCLNEDPINRPEMREIIGKLSYIVMASIEWEASLGGNSEVFSGIFNGR